MARDDVTERPSAGREVDGRRASTPSRNRGEGSTTDGEPAKVTVDGAPIEVRRLLKSYDVAMLRWDDEDHRYAIVREILIRGDEVAKHWLEGLLPPAEVREIVRRYAGSGCSEPERARLRSELALTTADIPVRPYIGFQRKAGQSRS